MAPMIANATVGLIARTKRIATPRFQRRGGAALAPDPSTCICEVVASTAMSRDYNRLASMMLRRNDRVRSLWGSLNICSGGPSSSMRPR